MIRRAFRRWVEAQDVAAAMAATELKSYVAGSLGAFLIVALASWIPATHEFTHLNAGAAMLAYLPALTFNLALNFSRPADKPFASHSWIILILGVAALQFFAAGLITWSSGPGAAIFSSIFIFTAAYHGHLHRVTLTEPFLALGTLLAGVVAMAMNLSTEHIAIFSVAVPAAISVELLAGTIAARGDKGRAEAERLRAAVTAQILDQRKNEVNRLSEQLVDVLGANHDVNNAVMSAQLAAEELSGLCDGAPDLSPTHLKPIVRDLVDSLLQVRGIVERVRASAKGATPQHLEVVDLGEIVRSVAATVVPRFPEVSVLLEGLDGVDLHVGVRGGALNLRRIIGNLLLNACEGNGRERATKATIRVQRSVSGATIHILIEDNGPGFAPELLAAPIEGFATSKKNGTGLGLYTTERLVHASGGVLERANRPEGGARVRVTLPMGHA